MKQLDYNDAVEYSIKDLSKYPKEKIERLAENLGIDNNENTVRSIAEILVSNAMKHTKQCRDYIRKLSDPDIKEKSRVIYKKYKRFKNSVKDMSVEDISEMFNDYDEIFFDSTIKKHMKDKNFSLVFKTAGEPTFTTEGVCISGSGCRYTITLPIHRFTKDGGAVVGGILCKDQLESLQRAMEHEMIHLVIFMFCNDKKMADQHGGLYMNMVSGMFGHKDYRHYIF